jgi:Secretion system C-terminal sorting domain
MNKVVAGVILMVMVVFGASWMPAPKISASPIEGNYAPGIQPLPPPTPPSTDEPIIVTSIPDLRSIAGSPGKNIAFAEDGQNAVVIYGLFSGDPTNFQQVYVSYSTNRGTNWINYGPLSTFNARRVYPGLDASEEFSEPSDLRIHYAWHQAAQVSGAYDSSPCYYAKEVSYPDGLITAAFRLPNSGTWDLWSPSIAIKDNYIIYIACNNSTFLTTNDAYIWRSTDYGETWDEGRSFFPGPLGWMWGPHMRFGSGGYMFFLFNRQNESNPSLYWPYYCESFDYGATWTDPQLIWQNNPPYPDMSNVTGWWYTYDAAVVNDTPVAAMKLGSGTYDYGELWVYRPNGGSPGSWQFQGTRLVGGDSTAPQTIERYAALAQDDRGDIFLGYQAIFETPTDTGPDAAMFVRPYNRNYWKDWGLITNNASTIEEKELEFAHNAPMVVGDSAVVGFIYTDAADYPTTGNLYFDYEAVPIPWIDGIAEENRPVTPKAVLVVTPNPFHNTIKFAVASNTGSIKVSIFDVAGKLVRELNGNAGLVWNGRNNNGTTVNSGVYFYKVATNSGTFNGKVTYSR